MELYENRLNSFEYWSGDEDKEILASVGFYFSGFSDLIICYYCKFDAYNFTNGDEDTLRDHKRYSPNCPFFTTHTTNYINTHFMSPRVLTNNYPLLAPYTGDFTLLEHRINSFINYPKCLKLIINQLCDAGFYYTNIGDAVCCYVCNIIIKDVNLDIDVWRVHKELNNRCPLLYSRKLYHNNHKDENSVIYTSSPTAPPYEDGHYNIPKCLKCKSKHINAVLLPCFHFCVCQECALTCTRCEACNVFTGGFFVVKIPTDKLNVVEYEQLSN